MPPRLWEENNQADITFMSLTRTTQVTQVTKRSCRSLTINPPVPVPAPFPCGFLCGYSSVDKGRSPRKQCSLSCRMDPGFLLGNYRKRNRGIENNENTENLQSLDP